MHVPVLHLQDLMPEFKDGAALLNALILDVFEKDPEKEGEVYAVFGETDVAALFTMYQKKCAASTAEDGYKVARGFLKRKMGVPGLLFLSCPSSHLSASSVDADSSPPFTVLTHFRVP